MAAYITVGAKTSHGGTVISGSPHTTHNGIPVARKGDKVICKKCKKVTTILSGDASFIVDGAPIARDGDVTSCGAKLIAIQQAFAESDFDVGSIAQAAPLVFAKSEPDALFGNSFVEDDEEPIEDDYVITNLGDDVDKIAADSPTLQENIKDLQEADWNIMYGPDSGGTYTNYEDREIVVSEYYRDKPAMAMHALTHEVGHATYQGEIDISSRDAYIDSKLKGEGGAAIYSVMIREELLDNGAIDIMKPHSDPNELKTLVSAYEKYGDDHSAWSEAGKVYGNRKTSTTGEKYNDFYGHRYDEYENEGNLNELLLNF